jgi:hypothetical protein
MRTYFVKPVISHKAVFPSDGTEGFKDFFRNTEMTGMHFSVCTRLAAFILRPFRMLLKNQVNGRNLCITVHIITKLKRTSLQLRMG